MSTTVTYIKETYNDLFYKYSDPRTRNWPFIGTPFPTLIMVSLYLLFVKVVGPRMMKNRKPFKLKTPMIVYNGIQTFISFSLSVMGWYYGWRRYSLFCEPIKTDHPDDNVMLFLGYFFFLIRFLEFTDTIFFILRKKFNQVSTLHVVHHAVVPLLFWLGLLCVPGVHYSLAPFLNAIVHTFMYAYYLFAALGPKYQKWLFWKKYLTTMQLTQFVLILIHTVYTLISDCNVPKWFAWIVLGQGVFFFSMFLNFYLKNYSKQKKSESIETKKIFQDNNGVSSEDQINTELSTSGVTKRKTRVD